MTMVARDGMLGGATRTLTQECRNILQLEVFPKLYDSLPWLEELISVGDDCYVGNTDVEIVSQTIILAHVVDHFGLSLALALVRSVNLTRQAG